MCVSEIVTFIWDCVGVHTSSVGDESVTGMLSVVITLVGFFHLD